MMIKITEVCNMGCKHCMNDAKPYGHHMTMDMFRQAVHFQCLYGGPLMIITGGEPTEHPKFEEMVNYATSVHTYYPIRIPLLITITTNGVWMQDNFNFVEWTIRNKNVTWQVTTVDGLYPYKIDTELPVFKLKNVVVCREIEAMYPMGRALENNLPWQSKASKCFNIRAISKQLADQHKLGNCAMRTILSTMAANGKMCTPHIAPNGAIKLGESDLCPICSWLDRPEHEILEDILNFECHKCDFINKTLPPEYQVFLNGGVKEVS